MKRARVHRCEGYPHRTIPLLKLLGVPVACVGWLLCGVFIFNEYLPAGMFAFLPGIVSVLIGVPLAYIFGRHAYVRQREHELVRQRYLDGGIDRIRAYLEQAAEAFDRNVSSALETIDAFDKGVHPFPRAELKRMDIDPATQIAVHRAHELLGDDVLSSWVALMTFEAREVAAPFDTLSSRQPEDPRSTNGSLARARHRQFLKHHKDCPARAKALVELTAHLEGLGYLIDRNTNLDWAGVDRFPDSPDVKVVVSGLRNALSEYENQRTKGPPG
jgi:hypothetical protein